MLNKLKIDKGTKIFFIVLVLYLIIMLIIFLPSYLRYKNEKLYIVTNEYRLKYEYGKWSKNNINSSSKNKYNVYEDNKYKGIYNGLLLNKIFLYDDSDNEVSFNGNLFLNRGSVKLDLIDINSEIGINESDKSIIDVVLNRIDIINNNKYDYFLEKMTLDYDNDGVIENIYSLNGKNEDINQIFSVIFIEDNNEITIINKDIKNLDEIYDCLIFNLSNVIDIKKDKKYELIYIASYPMGSIDDQCEYLYDLNKKKEIKNFCEK